jgi:hypothetical protein
VGDVRLHGRLAHEERRRDLGVREATREQLQHLELARRQVFELRRRLPHRVGRPADELLDHPPRHGRREQRVAARDRADSRDELLRWDVLEQEAARARLERVVDVLVHVEGRQHHDLRRRISLAEQSPRGFDPVHLRHAHVHQDDVRLQALGLGHCVTAVCRLADDLDVLLGLEDHPEARADERLVVDDQDADDAAVPGAYELVLAIGERRRAVSGRAQSRKFAVEPVHRELVDPHGPVEVLEQLRPEVVQVEALELLLLVLEQRPRRLGDQGLPAVAGIANPGGAVHGEAHVLVAGQ